MLGVLTEGNPPTVPATEPELASWIASAQTPHSWALDAAPPQTDFESYFGQPRDTAVIIDLSTMKIVDITDLGTALTELDGLLPQ